MAYISINPFSKNFIDYRLFPDNLDRKSYMIGSLTQKKKQLICVYSVFFTSIFLSAAQVSGRKWHFISHDLDLMLTTIWFHFLHWNLINIRPSCRSPSFSMNIWKWLQNPINKKCFTHHCIIFTSHKILILFNTGNTCSYIRHIQM